MAEAGNTERLRVLEAHVDTLRAAIREMIPIMDWANVKATEEGKSDLIQRYIEKTSKVVRAALDGTIPPQKGPK